MLVRISASACLVAWLVAGDFASPVSAASKEFEDMLSRVPPGANALMLLDVDGLLATPIGKKRKWADKLSNAYVDQGIAIPPASKRVVLAAELNPSNGLETVWESGVLDLSVDPSLTAIARAVSGTIEDIDKRKVVLTRRSRAVAHLGKGRLGVMSMQNRQQVVRWLRRAMSPSGRTLSPFLQQAVGNFEPGAQILVAIDLQDAVVEAEARDKLSDSEAVEGKKVNLDAVAHCLASLKGVTLEVRAKDKIEGSIRIEFSEPVDPIAPVAKPILLSLLTKFGAAVPDFEKWAPKAESFAITMSGDLSPAGAKRLLSVLEVPTGDVAGATDAETPTAAPKDEMTVRAEATLAYYKSLTGLINDVKTELGNTNENQAFWSEKYAGKIDQLPILNVDEELLTYSGNVSGSLRYQAVSKRSAGIRMGVRAAQPVYGTNYVYGPYGGYAWNTHRVDPGRTQISREEMAKYQDVKLSEWQQIDAGLLTVRRSLTTKYNREFE